MGKGTLTIYSASAGSGKTYKLTGIYLTSLFNSRYSYRKILAVTFTNKATAEMKSRILDHLNKLAVGENSEYLSGLINSTNRTEEWVRNEAKEILNSILHDFSRFSVSTIDSFFQKILRAFAREIGLHSGFNIELDHSIILSSAVDEMIASASVDTQLKNWLTTYAMSNIDEEKSWNLKVGIMKLAEELFKEKFKILSAADRSNLENKTFLLEYIEKIKSISSTFVKRLQDFGRRADEIFSEFDLSDDMFYRKGQGIPRYIKSLISGVVKEPGTYTLEIIKDPPRWSTGHPAPQLQAAINSGLDKTMKEAIQYYDDNIVGYNSAMAILSNIYALGILSDVLLNVHLITNSENSFLLSDAGEFLNLITREDQAPFIYEKVGNRFENFMIDEFQDTSIIQWENFKPLIENSMAEGFDNLVVGDVKQSIYRWRNSDWQILNSMLDGLVDNDRFISEPLTTNWRSRSNIIKFNNKLFTVIPGKIDETLAHESHTESFKNLYSEAVQADPGKNIGGYVRLEFLENSKEKRWQELVLKRLPGIIETFQDKGYNASDIGIIVRNGKEGAQVLQTMINYSNTSTAEKREAYNYNVVSNDSLLLSNSPVINFIVAVISVVNDPADMINRALMLRLYLLAKGSDEADKVPLISDNLIGGSRGYFPDGYEVFLDKVRQMTLFEATEGIIRFFNLGDYSWNVAYLNTFQDYIVNFTGSKNSDIQSFLDWWTTTGNGKSVVLPGNQEAMRILTIHKSKGLEFKVVLLPFLEWNLDHISSKQPVLWVKPEAEPFSELGIVPVKYSSELSNTIFAGNYKDEKYSVYLDNINLLYVALTRAKDAIYGFSVDNPRSHSTIAGVIKDAITQNTSFSDDSGIELHSFYNSEKRIFEYGEIPENKQMVADNKNLTSLTYIVSKELESLKLKLHGENYFSSDKIEVQKKINYGKLMHEVFEGINTTADISSAVRTLVLEGKLPEEEAAKMEKKVFSLINTPQVSEWFLPGNEVMTEAGILLPSGNIRRPDRVIFKDGKTIIIDFKFGEENPHYAEQVNLYRHLLADMGYNDIEAFIWYVDKNLIVAA
ncbi:MAG TPA: UvrD-helicase domain-containing protein [Bacteroidales bacterium]|nr:UvrD-helicase domain-containing protein [Bacteroidales bacterium]